MNRVITELEHPNWGSGGLWAIMDKFIDYALFDIFNICYRYTGVGYDLRRRDHDKGVK